MYAFNTALNCNTRITDDYPQCNSSTAHTDTDNNTHPLTLPVSEIPTNFWKQMYSKLISPTGGYCIQFSLRHLTLEAFQDDPT